MKTALIRQILFGSVLLVLISGAEVCQAEVIPFDSDRWTVEAEESRIVEYQGRTSLYLESGAAWITDDAFTNGSLEFDIAFSSARGFMGAMWRMKDGDNHEHFYVRPHQSGNPDANQYTPVFNGIPAWQLYHGEGHGVALEYPYDEWVHIKIVFTGGQGEVHVNSEEPALFMSDLKHEVGPGLVGLSASFAPAYFADFQYEKNDDIQLRGEPVETKAAPAGTIRAWMVSNTVSELNLSNRDEVPAGVVADLKWTPLASDASGVANLARVQGVTRQNNTALAKVNIRSESDQIKKLNFGYSDRVRVYLNNRVIYSGTNFYRSRDYRYLGTIGLFDSVYIPLSHGDNELWFAVSESFGGWGILAQFESSEGIELSP